MEREGGKGAESGGGDPGKQFGQLHCAGQPYSSHLTCVWRSKDASSLGIRKD